MSVKKLLYSVEVSIFTFLVSSSQSQQKEREKKKNPIHLVLSFKKNKNFCVQFYF